MEIDPSTLAARSVYKILTGCVVPRPIAWVSTVNPAGRPNLAPFSFFNVVSANPPVLVFSPGVRSTDRLPKDTYNNVRDTGEFVVNIVTEETAAAMNRTSQELPAEVDEFALAGLTPVPSQRVRPPRVGESPVHFECQVQEIITLGTEPEGGYLVIGRIVHIALRNDILLPGDRIDLDALRPVGRLVGNLYCTVRDRFELVRPPSQIPKEAA